MANPTKIITTALRITFDNPVLWFFGIFLAGGFNTNWLYYYQYGWMGAYTTAMLFVQRFIWLSPLALLAVGVWVGVIAIKILFILNVADITKADRLQKAGEQMDIIPTVWGTQLRLLREVRKSLLPVISMSLTIVLIQLCVAAVLFGPQFWLMHYFTRTLTSMLLTASIILFIFTALFSLLNFFGTCFAVLYKKSFSQSLLFGTHFIFSKLKSIITVSAFIIFCYAAGMTALLLINKAMQSVSFLVSPLGGHLYTIPSFLRVETLINLLLVVLFGFLNAFFNVSLFLLFKEYTKPQKFTEATHTDRPLVPSHSSVR